MAYLEYYIKTGQVTEIHENEPLLSEGYDYCYSNQFKAGDEFEQSIWVSEVSDDKNLISYSAIRNNPNAQRLLRENEELKQENTLIKAQNQALTERADFIEDVVAEMAVQVYQ